MYTPSPPFFAFFITPRATEFLICVFVGQISDSIIRQSTIVSWVKS